MTNYLDRKFTPEEIRQGQEIIALLQSTCRHDHGITEGVGWIDGQKIVVRQCPICGMSNPRGTGHSADHAS